MSTLLLLKDVAVGFYTTVLRNVVCLLIFNPDRIRATERIKGHVIRSQDFSNFPKL